VRPEVGSVVLRDLPSQSYYLSPAKAFISLGKLLQGKPASKLALLAQRINRMNLDVLAVQEVEDIDTSASSTATISEAFTRGWCWWRKTTCALSTWACCRSCRSATLSPVEQPPAATRTRGEFQHVTWNRPIDLPAAAFQASIASGVGINTTSHRRPSR
jgi:hypothetical protein